jgi:hypothetical protein
LGHLAVPAAANGNGYLAQLHFNVVGASGTNSTLHLAGVGLYNSESNTILPITTTDSIVTIANPPQINTASPLPTGEIGLAYNQSLAAASGVPPYTWSIQAGALPGGLTLNSSTGAISGTPTGAGGSATFTARVTDSLGSFVNKEFTVTILPSLSITAPSLAGEVGLAFARSLTATGGMAPYSWSVQAGTLPAGLTLNTASGNISGTPTAAGSPAVTVKVTDSLGGITTKELSFSIVPAPVITTTSLPAGRVGVGYSQVLSVTGGAFPYTWSVQSGTLPAGLTLNASTGAITGTPTTAGTSNIVFRVGEGLGNSDTETVTITITAPHEITTPPTLPKGEVGVAYTLTLAATGGTSPFSWAVQSGALPPGVSLNSTTGVISGKPTLPGQFSFAIWATDSSNPAAIVDKTFTMEVFLRGDANGDKAVNMGDVTSVERIILGLDGNAVGADANQDGSVDMVDVIVVERIILGIYYPQPPAD